MTETNNEPVFTGTPDQWWVAATPITEEEAAERILGDWYIGNETTTSKLYGNYRVSTPTLTSNNARKSALQRRIDNGATQADSIAHTVRKLIHIEIEPPEWLNAGLLIADLEIGSAMRGPWRKTAYKWQLLADARIAVNERTMSQLNPRIAVITELT
jgi:hypothetical protein